LADRVPPQRAVLGDLRGARAGGHVMGDATRAAAGAPDRARMVAETRRHDDADVPHHRLPLVAVECRDRWDVAPDVEAGDEGKLDRCDGDRGTDRDLRTARGIRVGRRHPRDPAGGSGGAAGPRRAGRAPGRRAPGSDRARGAGALDGAAGAIRGPGRSSAWWWGSARWVRARATRVLPGPDQGQ